jgi:hypothetical protein
MMDVCWRRQRESSATTIRVRHGILWNVAIFAYDTRDEVED